jgi:IclR family pca regulon transcriptional regulator
MAGNTLTNSLRRGLMILEAFTPAEPRMRLQEVVDKTGLPKGTVFRFLKTLNSLHYISYNPASKQYALTPKVMMLGFTVLSSMDVCEIAHPYLEELSQTTNQNVNLGILDDTEIVYIDRIRKRRILNIDLNVGSRLPVSSTSIGQAILAYLGEAERKRIIGRMVMDREAPGRVGHHGEKLMRVLQEVRRNGYALNDEEFFSGLRAIGAPVFDYEGNVDAGINIPVFSSLVSREELIGRYVPLLLDTAAKISAARGHTAGPPRKQVSSAIHGPQATEGRKS